MRRADRSGPASACGGRASPESGRIIAPSFEKSYCRTMRQVIDRHRTIEQGNVIFRDLHTRFGKRGNAYDLAISSTYGNLFARNNVFTFQSSLNLIFREIKEYEISFRSVMEKYANV